jgi:iron complex outermembrane receptor protein
MGQCFRVETAYFEQRYQAILRNCMLSQQVNWIGHRLSSPEYTCLLKDYDTVDLTLNARRLMGYVDLTASVRNLLDSKGKEQATISYPDNIPIAAQTFYFETSVHF